MRARCLVCCLVLVLALAVVRPVAAYDYKMTGEMTCTQRVNQTGACNVWSIKTSIDSSCFPGDTLVQTTGGAKQLQHLAVGDVLFGYDAATGTVVPSTFTRWLHFERDVEHSFVEIRTARGTLFASAYHNVAYLVRGSVVYDFARNARQYPALFDGFAASPITGVTSRVKTGVFAPLTTTFNFLATEANFLVHSFAHVSQPVAHQRYFAAAMSVIDWWVGAGSEATTTPRFEDLSFYMDPSVDRLASMFGMFVKDLSPYVATQNRARILRGTSSSSSSSSSSSQEDTTAKMIGFLSQQALQVIAEDEKIST